MKDSTFLHKKLFTEKKWWTYVRQWMSQKGPGTTFVKKKKKKKQGRRRKTRARRRPTTQTQKGDTKEREKTDDVLFFSLFEERRTFVSLVSNGFFDQSESIIQLELG